jgi:hypothetical protein
MSSAEMFYLALVLVGLIGFASSLAFFARQDLKMRKAREAEEARDTRRPAKQAAQAERYAKAA